MIRTIDDLTAEQLDAIRNLRFTLVVPVVSESFAESFRAGIVKPCEEQAC